MTKRKPYGLEPAHPPEEQRRINEESLAAQREHHAVEVTKRHRELAFATVWLDAPRPNERKWIEDGKPAAGRREQCVAQALADIEAAAKAEQAQTEELLLQWEAFGAQITGCTNHSGAVALEEARRQLMLHIEVRASMKAAQGERERAHLLEGARLCMLARPLLDAPIFEDEREALALWFDAEGARLSATVEPGPACAAAKE